MTLDEALELIEEQVRLVWTGTLVGHRAPVLTRRFEAMQAPKIGDLVLVGHAPGPAKMHIGRLVAITDEPMSGWDDKDEPAPLDRYWHIETASGEVIKWYNVMVLKILGRDFDFPPSQE